MRLFTVRNVLICTVFCLATYLIQANKQKDPLFIIFSKDRPIQLYALLESIEKNLSGASTIAVLYHAADDHYESGYTEVASRFPSICWYQQSRNDPRADFKSILLSIIKEHPSPHILFAVDDMVVTMAVDLKSMAQLLENTAAYGFYLRLGEHIDTCYMARSYSGTPPLNTGGDGIYTWKFSAGKGDWGYQHTTDMTLYRMSDVYPALMNLSYHSPNSLEVQWSGYKIDKRRSGLCYQQAHVVNIPLNLVQKDCPHNRTLALYTVEQLYEYFRLGKKIDINPLMNARYNTVHIEYEPTFIDR